MIICSSCGANMKFDPNLQKLKCEHCGKTQECSNEENKHVVVAKKNNNNCYEAFEFRCSQCGAKLISTNENADTFCSYCGSSDLIKENICKMQKPDCVIPFSISKEKCEEIYKKHLSKAWFAPEELKKDYVIEKIRGIYMPYWIYSFKGNPSMKFKASKSWYSGNYIYTQHYNVFAKNKSKYEGVIFDSSSNFYDDLSQAISDYNLNESKSFNEGYLSGFYVDTSDVHSSIYEENARKIIAEDAEKMIIKNKTCRRYDCDFTHLGNMFNRTKFDLGYFPVWFLSIKNKRNDRISYVAINGSTGKIAMDMPISILKFLLTLIAMTITIFLVLNMFLMVAPKTMLYTSIIVNLIAIITICKNYDEIYNKENRLMDEGIQYVNTGVKKTGYIKKSKKKLKNENASNLYGLVEFVYILIILALLIPICIGLAFLFMKSEILGVISTIVVVIATLVFINITKYTKDRYARNLVSRFKKFVPMPFKQKINKLLCPLIAIVLSVIPLATNFTTNKYYYVIEIILFILFGISGISVVKSLNLLASRKLPQLIKRGGDTDE